MGQGPSAQSSAVHPPTLQVLRLARAAQAFLAAIFRPPELWEAFILAYAHKMFLRVWLDLRMRRVDSDAVDDAEKAVIEKLEELRRENGPWMAGLRVFLGDLPGMPRDGEIRDIALALMTVSIQARESSMRWINDPSGSRSSAQEEMRRLMESAQAYQLAIGGAAGKEKSAGETLVRPKDAKHAESGNRPITRILPRGVTMETLEDVGRVEDCRRILKEFDPEVQLWECFCLVMKDDTSRKSIDTLVRRKKAGSDESLDEKAQPLFDQLQEIRKEHGAFVRQLAAFLANLPVGQYSMETRELALGFIVGGPVGREHATLWLSNPVHYRQEAATRFEGLVGRAMNYQAALRAFA